MSKFPRVVLLIVFCSVSACDKLIVTTDSLDEDGKARMVVAEILAAVMAYARETDSLPAPMSEASSGIISSQLVLVRLREETARTGISYLEEPGSDFVRDPWGEPYLIGWYSREDPLGIQQVDVMVWSMGGNGTNEFGCGDDVSVTNRVQQ